VQEYIINKNGVYNSYVGLLAAKGLGNFYNKFGFIERPNDFFGPGMSQFWGRKLE
jgi:hypothetical protein